MDESFYDAQRRHRRAGWRFTALALVGVVVTSLPVAVVLSPPLTALVVVVADLLSVEQRIQRLVAVGGTRTTIPYRRTPLGKLTRLGPA
jgi:hypothetical protein